MARDFAKAFYKSTAWKHTRSAYFRAHPFCELHLKRNEVVPGEIVHHKIHLSPSNIDDPEIATSWNNLETVCRECHALEHPEIYERKAQEEPQRYAFDENGNLVDLGGLRL